MSDLTLHQQQVLLGMLKGECLEQWWYIGDEPMVRTVDKLPQSRLTEDSQYTLAKSPMHPADCGCHGSGIVPLLGDAVRVVQQGVWSHADCPELGHCDLVLTDGSMVKGTTNCHGLGGTPATDAWVWIAAYSRIGHLVYDSPDSENHWQLIADIWKGEQYFYDALLVALKPMATNWDEAEEIVRRMP